MMKVIKMKQNKDYSVVRVASAALALFVFFFSLCVPSFAYTDTSSNGIDFSNQPIAKSNTSNGSDISTNYTFVCNSNNKEMKVSSSASADVYAYLCSSNNSLILASSSNSAYGYWTLPAGGGGGNALSNFDSTTQLYWWWAFDMKGSNSPSNISVPFFSDYSAGLSAVRDWIDNPPLPPVDPQGPLTISLPAGNAIFIDISGLTGVTGSLSTSTTQSFSSPHSWNPTLSYVDSIPSSGSPLGNPINWVGSGGTDVFGRYRNWNCTLIVQPNKKFIAVTNPFYNSSYLDPEHEDNNSPITISVSNYRSYTFVALNASYQSGDGVQNSYTDEQPDVPVPGGQNTSTTGASINDWLENIAHTISGFFAGAIGAVSTLVSAGSDFIHSLSGLYAWLPAPVYAVLTSALILVITIGVIKVFI